VFRKALCFWFIFPLLSYSQEASELLGKLITFKSSSSGQAEVGRYLSVYCASKGLSLRIFTSADSSYNFCVSLFPLESHKPNILLINHLDVVDAGNEKDWRRPPFSGDIAGDTIWGRGALDMKSMIVMQIAALLKMKKSDSLDKSRYNASVLFLSGEETGGKLGAKIVCERYLPELSPCVVFGEGGGGVSGLIPGAPEKKVFFISVAEKKNLWISLESKFPSHGHASIPGARNANRVILKTIYKVENNDRRIRFEKVTRTTFHKLGKLVPGVSGFLLRHLNWFIFRPIRKKILMSNDFFLPMVQNTFQLTKIENSPGAVNQIPQLSRAYFDCRLLPRYNARRNALRRLRRIIDHDVALTIIDESPDAPPTKRDKFYKLMSESLKECVPGAEVIPFLNPATSDNSYFRQVGIPSYGILPCILPAELLSTIHGVNERIPVKALEEGAGVYERFLRKAIFSE
jgi:carboxypeptidase PM20D1